MKHIPTTLAQLVALLTLTASACSKEEPTFCSAPKDITVSPDVACAIASLPIQSDAFYGVACANACGDNYDLCQLPDVYVQAFAALTPDGGASTAADAGAHPCPPVTAPVAVHCAVECFGGRRTEGAEELPCGERLSMGDYLAACAHLEAVSVHAFERLRDELAAHDAPQELVDAARRSAREEVRHAAVTARIARRHGALVRFPRRPLSLPTRPLFEVALENAVEGCVRETFGAALALVRAARASDLELRSALRDIARDECAHAALSWDIAEWASTQLEPEDRARIARAMHDAAAALSFSDARLSEETRLACGVPSAAEQKKLAALVEEHLLRAAA